LGSPIYSLDWSGNHLLVGMHNGITRIYKVQFTENDGDDKYTFEQISLVGEYKNTIHRVRNNLIWLTIYSTYYFMLVD
jgi:hypothetical protein